MKKTLSLSQNLLKVRPKFTIMPNSTIRLTRLYLVILFALCMPLYGFAQGVFNVEGVVKDAAGEPIIGANVVENGTQNGTVSDINGVLYAQSKKW